MKMHPLLDYRIIRHSDESKFAAIAFRTEGGEAAYAVTREILYALAEEFMKTAAERPAGPIPVERVVETECMTGIVLKQ